MNPQAPALVLSCALLLAYPGHVVAQAPAEPDPPAGLDLAPAAPQAPAPDRPAPTLPFGFDVGPGTSPAPRPAPAPAPAAVVPAGPARDAPLLQFRKGKATFTFNGETRGRSEYRKDFAFVPDAGGQHAFHLLRTRLGLLADLPAVTLYAEAMDGRDLTDERSPKRQYNPLDLHQGYLELRKPGGALKVGRQELNLGARLLISSPAWGNYVRSYDAARATVRGSGWMLDAFVGRVVVNDPEAFDPWKDTEELGGLYGTWHGGGAVTVDAYLLGLQTRSNSKATIKGEDGQPGDLQRYTPGLRLTARLTDALDLEAEAALQRGSRANDDLAADAQHLAVTYRMSGSLQPKLRLELNRASGDGDPKDGVSETFVPLYGTSHDPYGMVDFFRWQNVQEAALVLSARPHPKVEVWLEGHAYALDDAHDSWVDTTGAALRKGRAGGGARTAGHELDVRVAWTPSRHFKVDVGAARFLPGELVDQTQAAGQDVGPADWVYLQVIGAL